MRLPTSNTPENTPVDALVTALEANGHKVTTFEGSESISLWCDEQHCEVERHTLWDCTEIHWPFSKQLNALALGIICLVHIGRRPAYPKYVISERGQWLVKSISGASASNAAKEKP